MSVRKRLREVERLLPDGCRVEAVSNGKHVYVVVGPDGSQLRDERGLTIPVAGTPGDRRHNHNLITRVRRALKEES